MMSEDDSMEAEAEVEVSSDEVREHIGHLIVEEGHKLRMLGEEDMALKMETIGRQMIEKARYQDGGENTFSDSLFDVE